MIFHMEDKKPIISFKGADIVNGEATVIYGMDMDIHPGDFVYIVGKVGTGKTSIIRTIIAENPLGKGSATVCGYNLNELKEKDIPYLRRNMGVVFQDFQLLMDRSVQDNLLFVLKAGYMRFAIPVGITRFAFWYYLIFDILLILAAISLIAKSEE